MELTDKIFVAGHRGMVGSSIIRALKRKGYKNILTRTSTELDLKNQTQVNGFFSFERPDFVFLAAAKVGGIAANMSNPSEFLYDNLMINANVIHSSYYHGVKKLLFLGSSCVYPRLSPQPMKEEYLLDGKLEPTNEGYALGKIVGLKLCEYYSTQYGVRFIAAMPPNLYGENDNFDPEKSHVIGALIRKFHYAKINDDSEVVVWGTGSARREFMYVDDVAEASLYLMDNYEDNRFINVGVGEDISILQLANLVKRIVGFQGKIVNDLNKPDGMPQKLLDYSRIKDLGWKHKIDLEEGIQRTYNWFLKNNF